MTDTAAAQAFSLPAAGASFPWSGSCPSRPLSVSGKLITQRLLQEYSLMEYSSRMIFGGRPGTRVTLDD
jgi:hypothetical protein